MNVVNRNIGGPPSQGRKRECERRKRQMAKAQDVQLIEVLHDLPAETLTNLTTLDESQLGFLELEIEAARLRADEETQSFAQSVLDALGDED